MTGRTEEFLFCAIGAALGGQKVAIASIDKEHASQLKHRAEEICRELKIPCPNIQFWPMKKETQG